MTTTPPPHPQGESLLAVEQVDREAAASCILYRLKLQHGGEQPWMHASIMAMRMGEHDPNFQVQAFARHRLASTPREAGLREALEPVMHWYQSDEQDDRPLVDIIADVVADLQHDRALSLRAMALHRAGANLSICAQTTGGVAGPDAGLMLAIQQWAEADASFRAEIAEQARAALGTGESEA